MPNVRLFDTLRSEFLPWGRLIWPEGMKDQLLGPVGLVVGGAFVELANDLLHFVSPQRLLAGLGLCLVVVVPCLRTVNKVLGDSNDPRTKGAKISGAADCAWCRAFRICLFLFLAIVLLRGTGGEKLASGAIAARLRSMDIELGHIDSGVTHIESEMGNVKQETSTDPHKELANRGVLWTVDAFFEALRGGNVDNVKLFLAGHMTTDVPDSQGRPLPVILALNTTNAPAMLDLLVGAGLDVNHSYEVAGTLHPQRMTLLSRAIEKGSLSLVNALIKHHVDMNSPIQTFGAMGLTRDTNPLESAIYWKRWDIAESLLNAGADPASGDYGAYREAQALRDKSSGDAELRERLDALIARLKPHGSDAARIESQLRLQGVEQKLNQIALASLRTLPGSPERRQLDAEYEQLQIERTKLRNALNTAHQLPPP
ncbi:MAG TPA: hypothetical protein VNZ02_09335 [Steroidobacteraceae bacterium]|nr:hypothetical protein [Steroidobacteraceae bacterium]